MSLVAVGPLPDRKVFLMLRSARVWAVRVSLAVLVLWLSFSAGAPALVFGYLLLGWVLFRAWPGCMADIRSVLALAGSSLSARRSNANAGF